MNSRERLLKCIRHEPIDRVPISTYELVGWNKHSWENNEESYKKLMDLIREKTDCIYMFNSGMRVMPNKAEQTLEWKENSSNYYKRTFNTGKGSLESLHREDEGVHTRWTLKHLLEDISDIDKYLSIPYNPIEFETKRFDKEREELGDKGLMMISVEDPICLAAELFEMSRFLVYAVTEQEKN